MNENRDDRYDPINLAHKATMECRYPKHEENEKNHDIQPLKISIGLITEEEKILMDNNWNEIVNTYINEFEENKQMAMAQYIMGKQQEEIERLRKEINYLKQEKRKLKQEQRKLKQEKGKLKAEIHNLKEQIENFIPRRRVRRVYKMLKKILEQDGITNDLDLDE